MAGANKNTVVVLIHGAPLTIEWTKAHVPAILDAHYPGELGGDAIFDALYGHHPPAGRLTTTYYPGSINTARNISDMGLRVKGGITYKYYTGDTPLWQFGHGLSYTTFTFEVLGDRRLRTTTRAMADHHRAYYQSAGAQPSPAGYRINVTNTGSLASDVVVLGFAGSSHPDAPPNKELFDFARVHLAPGASTVVQLSIPAPVLSTVDAAGTERILPGHYPIEFGVHGCDDVQPASLHVFGEMVEVFSLEKLRARHAGKLVRSTAT